MRGGAVMISCRAVAAMFRRPWAALRRDPVLTVLLLALVVLQTGWPRPWASLPGLVDWQTILTLTGLLWLTKAVELSGFLDWLAQRLVSRLRNERMLALLMVGFAAGLATVLTNDVALFVVVPLALSLARIAPLRVERLIVFLALAVNAGSTLTPLGNPQNLFLWQASGTSFALFVAWMAPLAAGLMLLLLALTAVAFDARPLHLSERGARHGVAWRHFALLAALFAAFIVLTDHHQVVWACALAAAGCLALQRRARRAIDPSRLDSLPSSPSAMIPQLARSPISVSSRLVTMRVRNESGPATAVRAAEKPPSFAMPEDEIRTLLAVTARCTIPASWSAPRARATSTSHRSRSRRCALASSERPSNRSVATKSVPSCVPVSSTRTTFG